MSGHLAAQQSATNAAAPRYGIVQGYAPAQYRVKVTLAPSTDGKNPMTGYRPLCSPWVGKGWGMVCPAGPGEQHAVIFAQSHPDQALAIGRIFDNNHLPPRRADGQPAVYGEFVLVDMSGNRVQLTNDQKLLINGVLELDLSSPGKVVITAPQIIMNGDVTVNGTVTASGEGTFNGGHTVSQHKHPGVQPGSGNTETPQG